MRFLRIIIFTTINIILFIMLKSHYEIIYAYYWGDVVFIPKLPSLLVYMPIFIFQAAYQISIIYELLLKKFITKKLNFFFIIPIILIMVTLNQSPYEGFKKYSLPNFKIQELMFKIQTNLEEYRVNTKYYPKAEDRFKQKVLSKIPKEYILTDYTIKREKVKANIIYSFDKIGPYLENTENYKAPAIIVRVSSSGKKYWLTAIVKNNYIKGKNTILSYNTKPFILKEEILIRDRLRNKDNKDIIYHQLINSIKK